ncbi:MAG: MEDS domain-containing protein, partial [Candidatus Omnitrophica bacterium]|nr:MEDS domain-containing protein [Candidatus Omnitrophota bacterium]
VPYLECGLINNERCFYVTGDLKKEEICQALSSRGIDAQGCIERGQLIFSTKEESYFKEGFFSPLGMLNLVQYSHYEALKAGFSGLRGSGELNWVSEGLSDSSKVTDYERELNFLFRYNRLITLCQYDEEKVNEKILLQVIYTHPKVVIYGKYYDNPNYVQPEILRGHLMDKYEQDKYSKVRDSIIDPS